MEHGCVKMLDIGLIEKRVQKLSEDYRQALRAVEFLPQFGRVPIGEFISEVGLSVNKKKSTWTRKTVVKLGKKRPAGDWANSRFAFRPIARTLLRSHIRSKFRSIADRLDVEQLASASRGTTYSRELDDIIKRLRYFDERISDKRKRLSKLGTVIGPLLVIILPAIIGRLTIGSGGLTLSAVIVYIATVLLGFAFFAWIPLYYFVVLGGLRWKRLILLGQTGDVYMDVATLVQWSRAPLENTYRSENEVFQALGLPKPTEFPWDVAFTPDKLLSAVLAIALLMLALAIALPMKEFDWPFAVAMVLEFFALGFLSYAVKSTNNTKRYRTKNNIC